VTGQEWQIEFIPEKRRFVGRGRAPVRFIWLHLLRALNGISLPVPFQFHKTAEGGWRLENTSTGEVLDGYLAP
jgi:hypothetical protein